MGITRVEKVQLEIIKRYDNISNLYVAYMNCGKHSDDFGREFFHAVGEILQGASVAQLTLYHLNRTEIEDIVDHTVSRGGIAGEKKGPRSPVRTKRRYRKPTIKRTKTNDRKKSRDHRTT